METEMPVKKQCKRKPYMCALCNRAFSKALSLQRHMEDIHNIQETDSEDDDDDDNGEEVEKELGGIGNVMATISDSLKTSGALCFPSNGASSQNHGVVLTEHSLNDIDTPSQQSLVPQHQIQDAIAQPTERSGQSQQFSSSEKGMIKQCDGHVAGVNFALGCRMAKRNHTCGSNSAVISSHLLTEKNWILAVADQSAADVEVDLDQGCKDILAEAASAADIFSQIREEKREVGKNQIRIESFQESRIPTVDNSPPCSIIQCAQDKEASESTAVSPGNVLDSNEQSRVTRQHWSSAQNVNSTNRPKRNLKEFVQIGKSDEEPSRKQQASKKIGKQNSAQIETATPQSCRQKSAIEVSRDSLSFVSHGSGGVRTLRRSPRNTVQARREKAVCDLENGKKLEAPCKSGSSSGKHRQHKTLQQKILELQKANEETRKQSLSVSKLLGRDSVGKRSKVAKQTRSAGKVKDVVGLTDADVGNEEKDGVQVEKEMQGEGREVKEKVAVPSRKTAGKVIPGDEYFACSACNQRFPSEDDFVHHIQQSPKCQQDADEATSPCMSPSTAEQGLHVIVTIQGNEILQSRVWSKEGRQSMPFGGGVQPCWKSPKAQTFPCKYCEEVFKTEGSLRQHMTNHCGHGDGKCHKCQLYRDPPSSAELEDIARAVEEIRDLTGDSEYQHKRGKRLSVQYFQCIICNDRYAVEKHLRNHLKTHSNIVCQFCDGVFASTDALAKHIPTHNKGPLACRTCKQTFFSAYMLLLHMRGHTGNVHCKLCNAVFMCQGSLPRHMRQKHYNGNNSTQGDQVIERKQEGRSLHRKSSKGWTRQLNFRCQHCGNLHRKEATLKRHIERYHPDKVENPGQFVCEVCGAVRHKAQHLKAHMVCHQVPKHKCSHCGKVFVRRLSLKIHIQKVHEGVRKFHCQYCGRSMSTQGSLLDHERLHTGEKPYECGDCGKRFRLCQAYKTHKARKHSEEKFFACNLCPKRFAMRQMLRKHMNTHDPSGTYMCDVCGRMYQRPDLLKQHLVKHRQRINCLHPGCKRQFTTEKSLRYHMKKIHNIDLYRCATIKLPPSYQSSLQLSPTTESGLISCHSSSLTNLSLGENSMDIDGMLSSRHTDASITEPSALPLGLSISPSLTQDSITYEAVPCPRSKTLPSTGMTEGPVSQAEVQTSLAPNPVPAHSTLATVDPSEITCDPDTRLNDPTNLAISEILSQLCERT